jgi:Cu-Zn family superoxide dismutase
MWKRSVLLSAGIACAITLAACNREAAEPTGDAAGAPTVAEPTATTEPTPTEEVAAAQLSGPGGITGVVNFTAMEDGVHMVARVEGASPGPHGFHLHQNGACDPPDFTSAGDHFNPTGAPHGGPQSAQKHAGDFGNVEVGADGTGNVDVHLPGLTVRDGETSIVGKAVVLHQAADDLTTQPSGNSGPRVACGVVERVEGVVEPPAADAGAAASPSPAPAGAI